MKSADAIKIMSTAEKILQFYQSLTPDWKLPVEIALLFPFDNPDTWKCVEQFYRRYFNDDQQRRLILGINPGRFGAGITGVPFTDPKILVEDCGIDNPFPKKNELSAIFVYELIEAYGGKEIFYNDFFISSVCPLGFVKNGININYYDDKQLYAAVEGRIVERLWQQLDIGITRDVGFSLGKGTNFKYLKKLNDQHGFFDKVIPLPHPRWVMQYRRKTKDQIRDEMIEALRQV